MRIKKLAISGFKSIMDKVEFRFPEGISGIVGPNGCGKSNIVDAIRWCLGEQSPKQLRGRSMEDVIFSGTGERKPLGMAEVILLFENGDGSFPARYGHDSELSVTRRLYRSGDSEYLINNMPCRLKDILEMFMDTGLGNKAYSIIGQGQIGNIVEQRPEETRVMLEEAAGITKYRKKAAASQKKIELTQANLQRVEDILIEVERQMRSLKRQAAKAKRYKELSGRMQETELAIHASNYARLKRDSGLTGRSVEELLEQETLLDARLARHLARIESMQIELEEKDGFLGELRRRHDRLRDQVHRQEAEMEALAGEVRMREEMESRLRQEQEAIIERQKELEEEKKRISGDLSLRKDAARKLEGEVSLAEERLKARKAFLVSVREQFEVIREELGKGAEQEVSLTHESGYLKKIIDQITDAVARLHKERESLERRSSTLAQAAERQRLIREETARGLEELEEEASRHRVRIDESEQVLRRYEQDLKARESDLAACRSRCASLRALAENFEGYQMGVRAIMKAEDFAERRSGRVKGLLADVISVAPEYEQAVEAALGDRLQYIIVTSHGDGVNGVGYLKARGKGKGNFIPIEDYRNCAPGRNTSAGFAMLNDLVNVEEKYRPLVDALLEDTALVENLDEAVKHWRADKSGLNFITREGDMVGRTGIVSGGGTGRGGHGILSRRREISELEKRAEVMEKEISETSASIDQLVEEIDGGRETLRRIEDERYALRDDINESDKNLFRLGQEMDQVERALAGISDELAVKDKDRARQGEALSRIDRELDSCRKNRREEEEVFARKEIELKDCEREFEGLRDELAGLKTQAGVKAEEHRGLAREITRIEEYLRDSRERSLKIDEEISSGRIACERHARKREAIREQLHGMYDRLGDAAEAVEEAERNRQESVQVIKAEEKREDEARNDLEKLRSRINTARLEHSELKFRINSLVDTVKGRFDMDLAASYSLYLDERQGTDKLEKQLEDLKESRQRLGEVNLTAIREHEALKERLEFITSQRDDLRNSADALAEAIRKINRTSLEKFKETFNAVDAKLKEIFPILFSGGSGNLKLTDASSPLESGVLVEIQPPGKKFVHMGLLSGGEKALVAMALLFAIYMIRPSPFCLLDEVDAPLDEANLLRFNDLLQEIKRNSQVIMVTHNRRTMEAADRLFGVTMEDAGVSKTVAVDLRELSRNETPASGTGVPHLN